MEFKKREKLWNVLFPEDDSLAIDRIQELSQDLGLSRTTCKLFYNRGCKTLKEVTSFLRNDMSYLHDPYMMKDMEKAVARVKKAVQQKERIAIYGDYDVDGVTSVTLLYLYLKSLGGDVIYYIPSRDGEGYGVSVQALDKLKADHVQLMITVDTGITANDEIAHARTIGIETVVTDHHECKADLPDCCAVINPHRPDCPYPFKELAGVGVVFKLICAMVTDSCRISGRPVIDGIREICREYADLVAIGTIADVMPIVDENRLIVTLGLRLLEETDRKGLAALIHEISSPSGHMKSDDSQAAGRKKKKITSSFIGFGLAPRINAAGRISHATKAVELLLADTDEKARALAQELCDINIQRQVEENRIAEQAAKKLEEMWSNGSEHVIVLEDDNWQQGIIGIVASRLTEKYGVPSILISFDGATRGYPSDDDIGKGSGRSVRGMNLVDAMTSCEDLLVRYGGHELAAGLTIRRSQIPEFRRRINEYAVLALGQEAPPVSIDAECVVRMKELTMSMMLEFQRLEPFGVGNPVPNLILRRARVLKILSMGLGKHSKLILGSDGQQMTAVYFGVPTNKLNVFVGDEVDVLFQLNVNEYQDMRTLQMVIQDIRVSGDYLESIDDQKKRYEEIRNGDTFGPEEEVIPDRDDLVAVYVLLRREFRLGRTCLSDREMLSMLANSSERRINYIKLRYIIRILQEMSICGIQDNGDGTYTYDIYYNTGKTNIEKSSVLHHLRTQCRN